MIVTRTPLRVSLAGGGTDLPSFYGVHGDGAVISTAIDKCVHVIVQRRFEPDIRVAYTRTEIVSSVDELHHELAREALRATGIDGAIEIVTVADVPGEGTGLGSSSSVTVGLLHALARFAGEHRSPEGLAEAACRIEIEELGKPIGKQDQYIAAFGGLRRFEFHASGSVSVCDVNVPAGALQQLDENLHLFYTGRVRQTADILGSIARAPRDGELAAAQRAIRALVDVTHRALESGDIDRLGPLLLENWRLKRSLSPDVSSRELDAIYDVAIEAGATGGKLSGAGGGGFFLLYVPARAREAVRKALAPLARELPFRLERGGSRVLLEL